MAKLKIQKDRKQKFIEFCALGFAPYQAALKAGYSKAYANKDASKMYGKYQDEIEKLKPKVKEAIEEEFRYSAKESFKKLQEIQELALLPNGKGDYCNLNSAVKAEELKGKLYGAYELDNKQKVEAKPTVINILPVKGKDES